MAKRNNITRDTIIGYYEYIDCVPDIIRRDGCLAQDRDMLEEAVSFLEVQRISIPAFIEIVGLVAEMAQAATLHLQENCLFLTSLLGSSLLRSCSHHMDVYKMTLASLDEQEKAHA